MRAIEMGKEDLLEILGSLPPRLKEKFEDLINHIVKPESAIKIVEKFVEQYEDDDMCDYILAHTTSNLIVKITDTIKHIIKDKKKEGKKEAINTIEMGIIVIECLKKEAESIREALDRHENTCEKGDDCGAKN
jgi:hypothetical protein